MERAHDDEAPEPTSERPVEPGRLRGALSVLRGQRLVPLQLQAEWFEYQQIFDALLKRLSAALARQARSEKTRIESLPGLAEPAARRPPSPGDHKADLRSRAAAMRGLGIPAHTYDEDKP